jgi:hypothetical protein
MEITHHTVRCPLDECTASVTVRTEFAACPSRRHRDVTACSLLPPTPFVPPATTGFFPDAAPAVAYLREVDRTPCHSSEVACSRRCLAVLNAAESGAAEPLRCSSGVSDGFELVRQTQSPAITRLLWLHSV